MVIVSFGQETKQTFVRKIARLLLLPPTSPESNSVSWRAHFLLALGLGISRGGSFPAPLLLAPLLDTAVCAASYDTMRNTGQLTVVLTLIEASVCGALRINSAALSEQSTALLHKVVMKSGTTMKMQAALPSETSIVVADTLPRGSRSSLTYWPSRALRSSSCASSKQVANRTCKRWNRLGF